MNNQRPVTIFDPIHDSVREALEQRYTPAMCYDRLSDLLQAARVFYDEAMYPIRGYLESEWPCMLLD
jgi:hypothetical protein